MAEDHQRNTMGTGTRRPAASAAWRPPFLQLHAVELQNRRGSPPIADNRPAPAACRVPSTSPQKPCKCAVLSGATTTSSGLLWSKRSGFASASPLSPPNLRQTGRLRQSDRTPGSAWAGPRSSRAAEAGEDGSGSGPALSDVPALRGRWYGAWPGAGRRCGAWT